MFAMLQAVFVIDFIQMLNNSVCFDEQHLNTQFRSKDTK